jgi:hypothetical protein
MSSLFVLIRPLLPRFRECSRDDIKRLLVEGKTKPVSKWITELRRRHFGGKDMVGVPL